MRGRPYAVRVLAILALPAALTTIATAEESPGASRNVRDSETPLAEILVTARRRKEVAQEVPISLSVRAGQRLEEGHSLRLQEIAQTVPNLSPQILNPRQASIAIRGLGRNPANDGLESSVGVFVDGVYLGRPGMAVLDYFDIDTIEILRGPQGTLFGKNTTAGLLNITTRAPTDHFEAFAQATMGNQSYAQVHGAISGPLITDALSGRLSAFSTTRDGFVRSTQQDTDLGDFNRDSVRAQLAWQASDAFELRLIGDYSDQDERGPGLVLVDPSVVLEDGSIRPNNFLDRTARAGYTPQFEPFERRNAGDATQRVGAENGGVTAHALWRLGDYTLTSITAWRMWDFRPRTDNDFTPLDVQPQLHFEVSDEQFTTELRLTSAAHGPMDYQAGVFLFEQNLRSDFVATYGEAAADFAQRGLPASALDDFEVRTLSRPETRSAALYGQTNWRLAEPLSLSAGLRWTHEEKEAHIQRTSSGGAPLSATDTAAQDWRDRLGREVSVRPRVDEGFMSALLALTYRLNGDVTTYASASRGAKSGGINIAIVPSGINQTLEPEIATSYEVGLKARWNKLSLDIGLFDTQVEGYHATVRDPVRAAIFLANAGEVRTRGIELEAVYQPNPALQLTLAGGSADARFTSFRNAACPPETVGRTTCDFTRSRVPGAPPWTLNFGAQYTMPIGSGRSEAYAGADWFHAADYQLELSSYTRIEAYDVVNARIGIRSASGRWDMWLWGRNILDKDYFTWLGVGGSFNTGVVAGLVADPRTYGASLRMSY
jgi:iron complex outermembrane recepter protein